MELSPVYLQSPKSRNRTKISVQPSSVADSQAKRMAASRPMEWFEPSAASVELGSDLPLAAQFAKVRSGPEAATHTQPLPPATPATASKCGALSRFSYKCATKCTQPPLSTRHASLRAAPRTTVPASSATSQPCFSSMPSAARAFVVSRRELGPS